MLPKALQPTRQSRAAELLVGRQGGTLNTPQKIAVVVALFIMPYVAWGAEPTTASQSAYEKDIRKATTSEGLTKADLAWHALNTYGWDCEEVILKDAPTRDGYFVITCSDGTKLRVYLRKNKH
jgi:hypothetical protein